MNAVTKLQRKRMGDDLIDAPVIMNNEIYQLFDDFEPISTNLK